MPGASPDTSRVLFVLREPLGQLNQGAAPPAEDADGEEQPAAEEDSLLEVCLSTMASLVKRGLLLPHYRGQFKRQYFKRAEVQRLLSFAQ